MTRRFLIGSPWQYLYQLIGRVADIDASVVYRFSDDQVTGVCDAFFDGHAALCTAQ